MARSIWKGTLCAALTWAGTVYGQQTLPPATPPAPTERLVSIKEEGKPAQQCRIVKTWRTAEGTRAYQVQDVATHELLTIVEAGQPQVVETSSPRHSVVTRIFHWGRGTTPPVGSPPPPEVAVAQAPSTTTVSAQTVTQSGPVDTLPPVAPAPVVKPAEAPASDWHLSWGKPVDHESHVTQTVSLPQAEPRKEDPLADPLPYTRLPEEYKASHKADDKAAVKTSATKDAGPDASSGKEMKADTAPSSGGLLVRLRTAFHRDNVPTVTPVPTPEAVMPMAAPAAGSPAGIQSVLAAGAVQYVPVPVVTMPDRSRPPMPPPMMPPQAPNPVMRPAGEPNAFWSGDNYAARMNNMAPIANRIAPGVMPNAFTDPPRPLPQDNEDSENETMAMAGNAFASPSPQNQQPMPPMPAGAMVYGPIAVPVPVGQMPPSPAQVAQMVAAQGGYAPPGATMVQAGYNAPSNGDNETARLQELQLMLHQSLFPSHRQWAAEQLAQLDGHRHPEIVDALVVSAREDPAATVRAGCVHCLARMGVHNATLTSTLQALKTDSDPRVRQEVEQALGAR